jgi:hypothetical protein
LRMPHNMPTRSSISALQSAIPPMCGSIDSSLRTAAVRRSAWASQRR